MTDLPPSTKWVVELSSDKWSGFAHLVIGRPGQVSKVRFAFGLADFSEVCDPNKNEWPAALPHCAPRRYLSLKEVQQLTGKPATTLPVSKTVEWLEILSKLRESSFEETQESDDQVLTSDTVFRSWMERLRLYRGPRTNWPMLLAMMLDVEFGRQKEMEGTYDGNVFRDRKDHRYDVTKNEKQHVAQLYHHCRDHGEAILSIGNEKFWLLGFEFPNQANPFRRADLVGLDNHGGIVVFECKLPSNDDPPLTAVLEGLDYLSHMMREKTFQSLKYGLSEAIGSDRLIPPPGFENVLPDPDQQPTLVVLAPDSYFQRYTRSKRGEGWSQFAYINFEMPSVRIMFASTDYSNPVAAPKGLDDVE